MELFMTNIDFSLSKAQLVLKLATILHQSPFDVLWGKTINFNVRLHPRRPFQLRTGTLTLPSIEIGQLFLNLHNCIRVGSRDMRFRLSREPPRPEILKNIRDLPYIDPSVEERRREKLSTTKVQVNEVQFGWLCRDYAVSVECEYRCCGSISFNSERREIRINFDMEDESYSIAIAPSSINHLSASGMERALVFELNVPPSYERGPQISLLQEIFYDAYTRPPPRTKLSYLPIPDHNRVAPFTSLMVRVKCASDEDLETFRRLCKVSRFCKVQDYDYHIVHRNLFSVAAMSAAHKKLRQLDWPVAFQLESLLRGMAIDYVEANQLISEIRETVASKGKFLTATSIRNFKNKVKSYFHHEKASFDIVQLFRQTVTQSSQDSLTSSRPRDSTLYESFHVEVTPTTMFLSGPFPERSNRVIRAYGIENHENFLRVSFMDEGGFHIRLDHEIDGREFIQSRIGSLLFDGLEVAGRNFDFLAYSQSALKEHSVWFVKPFQDQKHGYREINAAEIIRSLGTFDGLDFDPKLVRCPARYAARIAQAFTATDAVKVDVEKVLEIKDISTTDGKYKFTDGVGTISNDLRHNIWAQLKNRKQKGLCEESPCAYQIRFMGSKGMVSVDHTLLGSMICLRPSMIKFRVPIGRQNDIEIARAFDRPGGCCLNRPLIMLLEGLGVPLHVFKKYQDDAIRVTEMAAKSLKNAVALLDDHGLGTSYRISSILLNLEKLGIVNLEEDEFYGEMIGHAINHVLRDLKNHARIPVPGAWTLVGVADTHQCLPPNTIFACIKPVNGERKYLSGPVLISRSPCIHPGDVTIVEAIGAPPPGSCFSEEPLTNTVVFSVQGERPIPSCLGGGDLDGDLYNLIPLSDPDYKDLQSFRPEQVVRPASYEAAKRLTLDRPSTMKDVAKFFMEYISSDVVGIVAINWLIIADRSQQGIFDPDCIKLADLHSNAVDYPKSGRPVPLNEIPMLGRQPRPDWNAPETVQVDYESGAYYRSTKAIGHLFRSIDLPIERQAEPQRKGKGYIMATDLEDLEAVFNKFNLADVRPLSAVEKRVEEFIGTDTALSHDVDREQITFIARLYQCYIAELRALCMANMITRASQLSEAEVIIGTIAQKSSQPRTRKEAMSKIREGTDILVRGIREDLAGDDNISAEQGLQRAWVAWKFAVSQGKTFGAKSFMWIALGAIFEAMEEIA